jgi:hypothetical protein
MTDWLFAPIDAVFTAFGVLIRILLFLLGLAAVVIIGGPSAVLVFLGVAHLLHGLINHSGCCSIQPLLLRWRRVLVEALVETEREINQDLVRCGPFSLLMMLSAAALVGAAMRHHTGGFEPNVHGGQLLLAVTAVWIMFRAMRLGEELDARAPGLSDEAFARPIVAGQVYVWHSFGLPIGALAATVRDMVATRTRKAFDRKWRAHIAETEPVYDPFGQAFLRAPEFEAAPADGDKPSCHQAKVPPRPPCEPHSRRRKKATAADDLFHRVWDGDPATLGAVALINYPSLPDVLARTRVMLERQARLGSARRSRR